MGRVNGLNGYDKSKAGKPWKNRRKKRRKGYFVFTSSQVSWTLSCTKVNGLD